MGMKTFYSMWQGGCFVGGFERTHSNIGKTVRLRVQILTAMRTNNTEFPIEFFECRTVVWLINLLRVLKPSLVSLLSFPKNWWQWRQTIEGSVSPVVPTCGRSCGHADTRKNLKHRIKDPFMNHYEVTQTFRPWQCILVPQDSWWP